MTTAQLSPGTVVDGRYTVGALVRTRPGAATHVASDPQIGEVQLTAYTADCFPSPLVLERSLRELRQLQGLQSARVVGVLACGKLPDGGLYEVNPASADPSLADHLARGPLPAADAAQIAMAIGEALLEAQKVGVIHRNLAGHVVFPGASGVRVGAFAVGEPHGPQSFGPPDTMAPEQVEGKVVDQRTLIYNLGALMHQMLTGAPVFAGDVPTQLHHHANTEAPAELHPTLRRALSKDARMRPMMLKQFLLELRALGGPGAQAPSVRAPGGPAAAPSARGWTMFMNEGQGGGQPGAPAPAPAPAPAAPAMAPAPAMAAPPMAPPLPGAAPAPSTRGWTMFMKEEGGEAAAAPAPAAAAPQPRTRGWTMFTEAADDDAAPPSPAPSSSPAPGPAAHVAPAPVGAAEVAAPKTRGWSMFMDAEDAPESGQAATAPLQAAAAPPSVPAPDAPKPRTRGWTMFTEAADDDAPPPSGPPAPGQLAPPPMGAAPAPATAPARAAAPPSAGPDAAAAPSSRGWTVFMEGATQAPARPEAQAPAAAAPEPDAPEADTAASPKKQRGWTMFMESPLPAGRGELGGPKASPQATPVVADEAADQKGWTVFGQPAPDLAAEIAAAREDAESQPPRGPTGRSQTMMVQGPPVPRPPLDPTPMAPTSLAPGAPSAGGHTVMSNAAPLARPDELAPTAVGVAHPSMPQAVVPGPALERMMVGSGPIDTADAGGSGKTWLFVGLGVLALAAVGTALAFVL